VDASRLEKILYFKNKRSAFVYLKNISLAFIFVCHCD